MAIMYQVEIKPASRLPWKPANSGNLHETLRTARLERKGIMQIENWPTRIVKITKEVIE